MDELKSFSPSLRFFVELTDIQTGVFLQYLFIVLLTDHCISAGFRKKTASFKKYCHLCLSHSWMLVFISILLWITDC